ncbi:MAG: site-specific DNA-methyltransferase [Gammaproteobacteria bacterium]|nr:site-specific DNA-methyltransferase [Gammaproteobacteria bacterium]
MSKPPKQAYELTAAEQRDLIALIQQGRPLPERYRFILFEDKREVELVWNGKSRDVCTTVLPFQTLEHIDEPRAETRAQGDLFDSRGRQLRGWSNKLIWGDNKLILSSLKAGALRQQIEDAGGLKLIYIDPPFDVGADFSMDIEIGGETFHKEANLLEQIAYRDTWGRGADSFISMIYERLILMRDLLAEDGSIYAHCDWRVNSYIRLAMNDVFGTSGFQNEITWRRTRTHNDATSWAAIADTILFFSRSESFIWNPQFNEQSEEDVETRYRFTDEKGRRYRLGPIDSPNPRPNMMYVWKGFTPPKKGWRYSQEKMAELDRQGRIYYPDSKDKRPATKLYLDESQGALVGTVWTEFSAVQASATERVDYPTQKPEALLERIIKASSNEGDLVADFFCGSGTTAAVAEKLGRKWIATDLGKFGIHTTRKRLIGVQRALKAAEKNFRAFEVLNLGRYERQAYLNVGGRLTGAQKEQALARKETEFRELILRAYKATAFGGSESAGSANTAQDGFFHGARNGRLVVIGPINLPVGRLFVEEVITECRKRGATRVDVLAFEFEMGLFPAVLEEARGKGIDLTPKYIPAEVFDKRAVDKGQVVFHDISFVEATPRYDAKNTFAVSIELTDFSVYYTQGAFEAAIAALKEGKSEVMCEQGQLYKVSKSKEGIITRDRLTKHWTDWVDYWAVDFDYMSRREIIKVPVGTGLRGVATLPGFEPPQGELTLPDFEERWTGGYIFENEWQSFRTRRSRALELTTAQHSYDRPGRYTVAVKVIDIFGNDTMTLVPVNVG